MNKMTKMLPMEYGENRIKPIVLCSGTYRDHKFAVLNLGTHPTAYIEVKFPLRNGYNDSRLDPVSVHGGLTYSGKSCWDDSKETYIGWDYAHWGDRMGWHDDPCAKEWTTEEIVNETRKATRQLIEIEREVNHE